MSVSPDDLPGADEDKAAIGRDGRKWFAEDYVKELRNEAAQNRVRARDAEAKLAAGDPDALTKAQAENRDLKLGQALTEAALKLGANPRLVKATLMMDGHLANLDPSKADFLPALEALVQTAVQNEPTLKGAPTTPTVPTKAGSDITHPNTATPFGRSVSRADVTDAHRRGDHEQIAKWVASGELDRVLGRI
jgi:hypothetical protein